MTTETKTDNSAKPAINDNKTVFAPLGKYAVIAVIMVSIIVTTAIMLDKQLNTVDEKIAAIENEISKSNTEGTSQTEVTASTVTEPETINEVASSNDEQQNTDDVVVKSTATIETLSAEVPVVTEAAEVSSQTAVSSNSNHSMQQVAETENTIPASHAQFAMTNIEKAHFEQKRPARIDAYKLKQKRRMADMFARIKVLESQQLDHYKANQEKQIVRLRERITQQQEMIETLVLRNNDMFELRATNMQRNQSNREQILNRI